MDQLLEVCGGHVYQKYQNDLRTELLSIVPQLDVACLLCRLLPSVSFFYLLTVEVWK
jgi:hypothetical protein